MEVSPNLSDKAQHDFLLVQKARIGDQKAYAELLGRYRDAIYFMLLKMVNNPSDAEDLTIEAFGKAFKNIGQYTPNFAFSTFKLHPESPGCNPYDFTVGADRDFKIGEKKALGDLLVHSKLMPAFN